MYELVILVDQYMAQFGQKMQNEKAEVKSIFTYDESWLKLGHFNLRILLSQWIDVRLSELQLSPMGTAISLLTLDLQCEGHVAIRSDH